MQTVFVMHPFTWLFNQTGVIKTNLTGNGANLFETCKTRFARSASSCPTSAAKNKTQSPGSGKLDRRNLLLEADWRKWQRWRCVVEHRAEVRATVTEQTARGASVKPNKGKTLRQIIVVLIKCLACSGLPSMMNGNFQAATSRLPGKTPCD